MNASSSEVRLCRKWRICTPVWWAARNSAAGATSPGSRTWNNAWSFSSNPAVQGAQLCEERRLVADHLDLIDVEVVFFEPGDGFLGHDPALVHDDHLPAGAFNIGQQVRGNDDVHALLFGDVADEFQHLLAPDGIHARSGLVEQQQLRIVDQRLGQLQPLLHAGGIGVHQAVARFFQAHVIQDIVGSFHGFLARHAAQFAQVGGKRDGVHARDQAVAFRHVADAAAQGFVL